jgi:hypothetical protein
VLRPADERRAVRRSVKLMHAFLAASAVILLAGALVLGWLLTTTL